MITQIITHTPSWVFGLFVLLIAFGLQQTRSRNVNAALAYLLPLGMIGLSLFGIHSSFGMEPAPVAIWAMGLLIVTGIRFKYFRDERVTFTRASRSFFIPGSWIPLCVIVAIFITKYAFAIMRALHAEMAGTDAFIAVFSLAYGCYSGYFSSRAANLVYAAKGAE